MAEAKDSILLRKIVTRISVNPREFSGGQSGEYMRSGL